MPILVLLGAAFSFLGAAVGAAALSWNNATNVKMENVTKERAKWRDKVREKALNVHKAATGAEVNSIWLDELHLEFTLILSPTDPEDRAILKVIQGLKAVRDEPHLTELADRISLLLKHDWERAKWEARGLSIFSDPADFKLEPKRMSYDDFKREQSKEMRL